MAKIYSKWQKWDNIVSDLLKFKTKISKIFNFKDKIVYQITFRKKKQSALGDWTQLAWAQVHYSNHYATGTLASGLWSVQNLENVWILKQISYSKSSFQMIHNWFFSLRKLYAEILLSTNQNAFKLYPAVLVVYTNKKKL